MPCGFCGRSGIAGCSEIFMTKGKSPQAESNCQHAHKFQYQPSLKSTSSTPSTNIPILCSIPGCTRTIGSKRTAVWKYNMPEHIRTAHPGYSSNGIEDGVSLPPDLARAMFISPEEEHRIGIPKENIPPKPALPSTPDSASTRGAAKRSHPEPATASSRKRTRR